MVLDGIALKRSHAVFGANRPKIPGIYNNRCNTGGFAM
jgi:hypothetical protein